MNTELNIQSPWISYSNKVRELFKRDPEIKMVWSDKTCTLDMYVDNPTKADALSEILPAERSFGKIIVKINILPSNDESFAIVSHSTIEDAFKDNPIFSFAKNLQLLDITYVVFAKEVIQYFNDDLGDYFGNANCLAEDLARDVFENVENVLFCTDIK